MRKWRTLATTLVAAAAALTVVTVTTQSSASASSDNPTFVSGGFGSVTQARAYNVAATGVITILPVADAKCAPGQTKDRTAVNLTVPGIATVNGLEAQCTVSSNGKSAVARANVADIDLFNGKIKIKALESVCTRFQTLFGGVATVGSTYGSLVTDFNYSRNGSGAIVIPGLATVAVDVNTLGSHTASSALVVVTLLNTGQVVVISACSLQHQSLG